MKKIVLASIALGLALAIIVLPTATDAAAAKPKTMKGKIVSLDDIIKGKKTTELQLTKEKAQELVDRGSPLVFLYNKKVYFVQNEGGNFVFQRLADFAHRTSIGITGIPKTVSGINYIIMTDIHALD